MTIDVWTAAELARFIEATQTDRLAAVWRPAACWEPAAVRPLSWSLGSARLREQPLLAKAPADTGQPGSAAISSFTRGLTTLPRAFRGSSSTIIIWRGTL